MIASRIVHAAWQFARPARFVTLGFVAALSLPSLAKVFQNPDGSLSSSVVLEYKGAPIGPDNPLPIQPSAPAPATLAPTDASGSIATANVFQTALPTSSGRKVCTFQNPPAAGENLLIYDRAGGTPSAANAYVLVPGQTYSCNGPGGVVTNAIQVAAASAGHTYAGSAQ